MIKHITYPSDLHTLIAALHGIKLLLLGEIHGVKENVHIIESLIKKLPKSETRPIVLAFEWLLNPTEVAQLNNYIHTETNIFPNAPFFSDSDGRFSVNHKELIDTMRQSDLHRYITIETFDTNAEDDYERAMANNLVAICRKYEEALVIAETGIIHARKTPARDLDGKMSTPMATYIPNTIQTISVFIRYLTGTVIVEGETYNIKHAASQVAGPGDGFDFELSVASAQPAKPFTG